MKRRVVKPGDRFNKLTVIEETAMRGSGRYFRCLCDCGTIKEFLLHHLTRSMIKSCGCHRRNRSTKHGMWRSRDYSTWENMVQRCTNPRASKYHLYGGRGIKVCDSWLKSFATFHKDMGNRPPGTSLDRIDPDKGYSKENCRWATTQEQLANLRHFVKLVKNGGIVKTVDEWIEELGIEKALFRSRVLKGLSFKSALLFYVDVIVLKIDSSEQTIYHLDDFLRVTGFNRATVVELLDQEHEEPYCGMIMRYLAAFKRWPDKYQGNKFLSGSDTPE